MIRRAPSSRTGATSSRPRERSPHAPPPRRRPGGSQGLGDPRGIDRRTELLEARRPLSRADGEYGLPNPIAPTSCGGDHYDLPDADYIPLAGFTAITRPGPHIVIWELRYD